MSSGWSWPLTRLVSTDEYGWRMHPIYHELRLHRGIDLAASKNDHVYCVAEGRVVWAGYNGGEGNSVHVVHPDGTKTKYFHNTSIAVSVGQVVHEGTLLSYAGTTGDSTGVHVHFETHSNANADSPVNPRDFMAARGAPFGSAPASGGGYTSIPGDDDMPDEAKVTQIVHDQVRSLLWENQKNGERSVISEVQDRVVKDINKSLGTITKAIVDSIVLQLKNVITRERWQLFSITGKPQLVGVNMATGAFSVYPGGINDPQLAEDIAKEKISSQIDPGSGKRIPDNPYAFPSEEAIEAFIDGLKVTDAKADV